MTKIELSKENEKFFNKLSERVHIPPGWLVNKFLEDFERLYQTTAGNFKISAIKGWQKEYAERRKRD